MESLSEYFLKYLTSVLLLLQVKAKHPYTVDNDIPIRNHDVMRQMLQLHNYDTNCCSESVTNVFTTLMNGITQRDTRYLRSLERRNFRASTSSKQSLIIKLLQVNTSLLHNKRLSPKCLSKPITQKCLGKPITPDNCLNHLTLWN